MFEKEAEEWVRENMDCCKTDNSVNQPIPYFDEEERCCAKSAFQDGAEFGYNKAKEWHYVKDELPPEDVPLLCVRGGKIYVAWYYNGIYHDSRCCQVKKPYAWKEIVLPELKETE